MATRNEPVRVSPELFEVLALFDTWRERTGGAVDAAAETAGRLWQSAAQRQQPPSAAELDQVVADTSKCTGSSIAQKDSHPSHAIRRCG